MLRHRPAEETARLGDELYERAIRAQVELSRHGQIVAIDVDSGSWAVADTVLKAAELLRVERRAPPMCGACGSGIVPVTVPRTVPRGEPVDRGVPSTPLAVVRLPDPRLTTCHPLKFFVTPVAAGVSMSEAQARR